MKSIIKNNCFMLKYIFKYVPGLIIFTFIMKIYVGFVNTFTYIYVAKFVLDSFQKGRGIKEIIIFLIFLVVGNVVKEALVAYYEEEFFPVRKERLKYRMHTELFDKAKNMELSCYDNPDFYNDFIWSINESTDKALDVLHNSGKLVNIMTQILSIVGIILTMHWSGLVIVAVYGTIASYFMGRMNKLGYDLKLEQNPLQRKRDYISRVLYLSDYAKEIRLSNVKNTLIDIFSTTNACIVKKIRLVGKKLFVLGVADSTLYFIFYYGYMAFLSFLVLVKGTLSLGSFFGLHQGSEILLDNISNLGRVLTDFQKNSLYIEKFKTFLAYESKMEIRGEKIPDAMDDLILELKNVSFCYEGNKAPTLKNINLTIKLKQSFALVGFNGAGKSTLVKLIMRLYDPTEGVILLNGTDIRKYDLRQYHSLFGVVFQDYKLFAATIAENVIMDNVKDSDIQTVYDSLEKSDFTSKLKEYEKGIETPLTREFSKEGVNLSGGESQKIAIARVFQRKNRIIILDEPSSALDPETEFNINQSMMKAADEKSVIYISHRLSTTKMADYIIMLDGGQIAERGSHDELMAADGKYAKMFKMQAEKYAAQA